MGGRTLLWKKESPYFVGLPEEKKVYSYNYGPELELCSFGVRILMHTTQYGGASSTQVIYPFAETICKF